MYATALENGVKSTDIRQDAPVRFGPWTPTNYEGGYRGPVTVADALAHSINTVAVRLASEVGGAKISDLAHRFGIKSLPDQPDLSVALGAYEVNLLELTGAYQVFQQGGRRAAPYLIEQITTSRGDSVYGHDADPGASVYGHRQGGRNGADDGGGHHQGHGPARRLWPPGRRQDRHTQNWRDAWFVGFTPDWVCGVWIGNDNDRSMNKITGGQLPAEIWRRMMIAAHQGLPVRDFDWMPAPEPEETAPASDGGPAVVPAAEGDPRPDFYQGLSADFGQAASGIASPTTPSAAAPEPSAPSKPSLPAAPALAPAADPAVERPR